MMCGALTEPIHTPRFTDIRSSCQSSNLLATELINSTLIVLVKSQRPFERVHTVYVYICGYLGGGKYHRLGASNDGEL
jgi:hypothetical protein